MGRARGPPRRLRIRTASSPLMLCRCRRNAAGEDSRAASGERKRKASEGLPSAAICNRRNWAKEALSGQPSTAPQAPDCSACSIAHRLSWADFVLTIMTRVRSMPAASSAGAYGRKGGAIHAIHRPCFDNGESAGPRARTSPMPMFSGRSSVKTPAGQPPPGSSASSAVNPLRIPGNSTRESWPARHTRP